MSEFGNQDRRDPTPVVLARLETIVASIKDDVAEIRLNQHTFVTHDRMELEIAARNNAMGQITSTLADHIRQAEAKEREGKEIVEKRLVPLERERDEMRGAFKTLKFLMYVLGVLEAVQSLVIFGGHIHG